MAGPVPGGYGSGRKLAQDAQLKLAHDKRAEAQAFADPKAGKANFGEVCGCAWAARASVDTSCATTAGRLQLR